MRKVPCMIRSGLLLCTVIAVAITNDFGSFACPWRHQRRSMHRQYPRDRAEVFIFNAGQDTGMLTAESRRVQVARQAEPLMPWRIPNTQRFQWLSVRELLLRERILMVSEYIDDNMANAYLAMLLYLQSEDAKKPVQIYFSSPGAALKPALALYDTIGQLKAKGCKVTTVSYSLCAGMGAFLAAAGSPGRRFATPNSLFLLSKTGLESPVRGQATEIELEAKQMLRESERIEEELSSITGRPMEQIRKDLRRNFYLTAAEAVEYGLIDKVLVPEDDKGSKLDKGTRDPWSGQVVKPEVGFGVFADPDQPRTAV
mmetsp:Transcript_98717/g.235210  ORF Transcript_98717/g.235210 Transcript_98717/m.235210 type:complete len:313 (+) Transcript_98717:56-994(+)